MDLEEFREQLMKDLPGVLSEETGAVTIEKHEVEKLQGESYKGLVVRRDGNNIALTLNVNDLYNDMSGNGYEYALDTAMDIIEHSKEDMPQIDLPKFDYEEAKNRLIMQTVPVKGNEKLLDDLPHKEIEDLAVVYRILVANTGSGIATVLVNNSMLENYGIDADTLDRDAMKSAPEICPGSLKYMEDVLMSLMQQQEDVIMPELVKDKMPMEMLVASVDTGVNGAAVINYPGFMDRAAAELGGDVFVLPSSLHELILLRDDGTAGYETLQQMVREVNRTQVPLSDRLSDNVYHYDSRDKVFELAEKFEARRSERTAAVTERGSVLKDLSEMKKEIADRPANAREAVRRSEAVL